MRLTDTGVNIPPEVSLAHWGSDIQPLQAQTRGIMREKKKDYVKI